MKRVQYRSRVQDLNRAFSREWMAAAKSLYSSESHQDLGQWSSIADERRGAVLAQLWVSELRKEQVAFRGLVF
jgi:hypothetical protein